MTKYRGKVKRNSRRRKSTLITVKQYKRYLRHVEKFRGKRETAQ